MTETVDPLRVHSGGQSGLRHMGRAEHSLACGPGLSRRGRVGVGMRQARAPEGRWDGGCWPKSSLPLCTGAGMAQPCSHPVSPPLTLV